MRHCRGRSFQPRHRRTRLETALEYLNRVLTRTAVVFLISDFLDQGFEKPLRIMSQRHDLIAIHLWDPRERDLSPAGLIEMEDSETGERVLADTSDSNFRKRYEAFGREREESLDRLFKSFGIDRIVIDTSQPYAEPLIRFFRAREKRR